MEVFGGFGVFGYFGVWGVTEDGDPSCKQPARIRRFGDLNRLPGKDLPRIPYLPESNTNKQKVR